MSVIVLNWNGGEYLERCISSVLASNYPREKLEIIIVDNASKDGSALAAKRKHPDVVLVENRTNLGFSEGNNVGIRISKGDVVILLNNDVEVDRNWLQEIAKVAADAEVGIVGCKLLFGTTGIIQTLGFVTSKYGRGVSLCAGRDNSMLLPKTVEVDYVSGAALAVKRSVLHEVGLLDPFYFAYYEDTDLCYRAKRSGKRVVVATSAVVRHYVSQSWKRQQIRQIFLIQRNGLYFKQKFFTGSALAKMLVLWPLQNASTDVLKVLRRGSVVERVRTRQRGSGLVPSLGNAILSTMAGWLIFYTILLVWPVYQRVKVGN